MIEKFVNECYNTRKQINKSEFVALLKQANTDSSHMAEIIGVSEAQLRFCYQYFKRYGAYEV